MTIEEFLGDGCKERPMKRRSTIVLTPEADGSAINGTSPDIAGLVTFGTSRAHAIAMAKDAAPGKGEGSRATVAFGGRVEVPTAASVRSAR